MDINHIHLTTGQVAVLYKDTLVANDKEGVPVSAKVTEMPKEQIPAKKESSPSVSPETVTADQVFRFLGNNKEKVLILVDYPHISFLPDERLNFLTGILTACKLSLEDVAILNLQQYPGTSYKNLIGFFQCSRMLLFGKEPGSVSLPVDFPSFQLQSFNGCTYHWCPSLDELEKERTLKMKLWNNLKQLFQL